MGTPEALESDVTKLAEFITTATKDEAKARQAAEKIAEGHKAKGVDLTDLEDPTAAEAFEEISTAFKAADSLKDNIEQAKDRQRSLMAMGASEAAESGNLPAMSGVVTLAERFTQSAEYKAAAAVPGGRTAPQSVSLMSAKETMTWFKAGCPSDYHLAATVDGSPLVPVDQQLIPPVEVPVRQVQLLSLYNQATTTSELVRYAKQDTRTDVAAETPYGTDSPEATYEWSTVDSPVKRITQFVPVPLDNLMDQGALSGIINGQLGTGVRLRLESQTLNGDGTGDNLTGILNTANIGAVAGLDKTVPDVIHEAITAVRISLEDDVTAVVIHPTDYEAFALTKDSAGMYVNLTSPAMATQRTVWGYPAIVTTAIPQATTLVGNFRAGATLWNRMGLTLEQGSQHSDFFIKGLVAYMATVRAAFSAVQPAAFAAITGVGTVT